MTVLVTGGTGFVGLNLLEALLARGERVVSFALDAPPPDALRRLRALPGTLALEQGDVREPGLAACLRRHGVDRLFPFAAVTAGPERERDAPEQVLEVNVLGLVSQLRAARDAGVRRVVAPSSAAVYGSSFFGPGPMREDITLPAPTGLYGVSKFAAERAALRMGAVWGLDVVAARIGAVFGPWERDTGLRDTLSPFWRIEQAARAGQTVVLPVLPASFWLYSRDAAAGLLHLLDAPGVGGAVFNLCSGIAGPDALPAWCGMLEGLHPGFSWRHSADPADWTIQPPYPHARAVMDTGRIRGTGWSPGFTMDAALADYRGWVRAG